mmetsp:Transcript_125936/g.352626  ORF Transcript_125936/g.352626 Transcript_125936/m.352626 type:complete len:357 (-) Transcript_125936:176-1246(-)
MSLQAEGAGIMPSAPLSASGESGLLPLKPAASFIVGLVLLSAVVLLWVFSSALTQFLYNDPDLDYEKPTALTTFCTATASVFLVPQLVRRLGRPQEGIALEGPSFRTVALITANWFLCQWTFNLSLAQTALSTNTLLSSSSVVWAYVVGLVFARSRPSLLGVVCVASALAGVTLAVLGGSRSTDPRAPKDTLVGEATALGSAIAYGFFSNGLAAHVRPQDMSAVWGYMGLLSIALGSVLMALGHLTGLEPFEVPSRKAVGIMLLNGFLGTSISDYVWARGLLLTSPLVATVALNMSIPVSFFVDAVVLRQHAFSWTAPLGAFLVFLGVVAGGVEETMREPATSTDRPVELWEPCEA